MLKLRKGIFQFSIGTNSSDFLPYASTTVKYNMQRLPKVKLLTVSEGELKEILGL